MGRGWTVTAGLVLAWWAAAAGGARAAVSCEQLTAASLPHAQVTSAATVQTGAGQACRIAVVSRPTADSEIRIKAWIPLGAAWNGKYVQIGNGGFAGAIDSGRLQALAARGYAAAGTDDGHEAAGPMGSAQTSWARGHPQKVVDYGWRAIKETTEISKALLRRLTGAAPAKAYFDGCSDGGREALMEAQRFPADFDGIVAGAPASDLVDELVMSTWVTQQLLATPQAYLPPAKLGVLQARALADCGGGGPFIRDPLACRFDPTEVQCPPGQDAPNCLTAAQVATARAIYGGLRDRASGRAIYPGYTPGAEAAPGAWSVFITGPSREAINQAALYQSGGFFRDFVFENDPAFDFLKSDVALDRAQAIAKWAKDLDSVDPDLSAFRARGGKLIQYHGWNDPAIPARTSILYFENVRRTLGDVSSFYRLYMIPGMLHCGGGPGPSKVDWLALIDGWVTTGEAPAAVNAVATPGQATPSQVLAPYGM